MAGNATSNEDYERAVAALLSPVHQASTPAAIREASARRRNTLVDMTTYLQRIGIDLTDDGCVPGAAPPLVIHVTGTKGKGSTLSFCESIMRNAHGLNTGLFTSPHLVTIRERIRINGVPLSKETFAKVYWKVRRKLESCVDGLEKQDEGAALPNLPLLPGYFRMLTLMAIYTFYHHVKPKLDVILLEVGMGGRYDATNVFEPRASSFGLTRGVTVIDYDHTRVLGSTLEQIAWEKAGIYVADKVDKIGLADGGYEGFVSSSNHDRQDTSCPESIDKVFASASNTREVLGVLERVANENLCRLETVHCGITSSGDLGIGGDHQRGNAALAMALCKHATRHLPSRVTEERVYDALAKTSWPGRCQTLPLDGTPSIRLRCDGAHTPVSMNACIDWFVGVSGRRRPSCGHRALVFNCSHERNPLPLLHSLRTRVAFDSVYFCRADFERPSAVPKRLEEGWLHEPLTCGQVADQDRKSITLADMMTGIPPTKPKLEAGSWQGILSNIWQVLDRHCSEGDVAGPEPVAGLLVKEALDDIMQVKADSIEVLVTGSLYLVGSALVAADWEEGESVGDIHAV